jgi:hypothetical protein
MIRLTTININSPSIRSMNRLKNLTIQRMNSKGADFLQNRLQVMADKILITNSIREHNQTVIILPISLSPMTRKLQLMISPRQASIHPMTKHSSRALIKPKWCSKQRKKKRRKGYNCFNWKQELISWSLKTSKPERE